MDTQNISIRSLMLFIKVLDTHSFSEVARRENLAVSVVSRLIRQLEQSLNQQLFYRNTRAVIPTEAGRVFGESARLMVEQFLAVERQLSEREQEPSGVVRINAPVMFGQKHIATHLGGLYERYPKLSIELTLTDDFIDPHQQPADLVFRISDLQDSRFHARVIAEQHAWLVASPEYLARHGTPTTIAELSHHRAIHFAGQRGKVFWHIRQQGKWQQYQGKEAFVSNNTESLITACKQSLGLLMLPDWALYADICAGALKRVLADHEISTQPVPLRIAMLYPETRHLPLSVRAVLDYFVAVYGEPVYWQSQGARQPA